MNSGDLICALSAYKNDYSEDRGNQRRGLLGPLSCTSDCLCGFLSSRKTLECDDTCICGKLEHPNVPGGDSFVSADPQGGQGIASNSLLTTEKCRESNQGTQDRLTEEKECNGVSTEQDMTPKSCSPTDSRPFSDGLPAHTSPTKADACSHTSCYLYFYSQGSTNTNDSPDSPFDCTSLAFPVRITTPQGETVPQVATHRCSVGGYAGSPVVEAADSADVIVKQVVFDAEQFLDDKLRSMDTIKGIFVSLKDYDMQIVQVRNYFPCSRKSRTICQGIVLIFGSFIAFARRTNHVLPVETRIKEPVFIRTLRLKFNLLNPLNKNPPEAETERGSYIAGFMCSEILRNFKNSYILIRILQWYKKLHDF